MDDADLLAERFDAQRPRLTALATRILGSAGDAEDAVQEAWLRLAGTDASRIASLDAWLTTVLARVCLNMLDARRSRPVAALDEARDTSRPASADPAEDVLLADSVGAALLIVLNRLTPGERLAFVLHDVFAVPFEEIAPVVGRSVVATRQLASRARRQVHGAEPDAQPERQHEVVAAFLQASRTGDFTALVRLLHPEAVLTADPVAVSFGATARVVGAEAVARTFAGRAQAARLARLDGTVGAVWNVGGSARVAFEFTVDRNQIVAVHLVADPEVLESLAITPLAITQEL